MDNNEQSKELEVEELLDGKRERTQMQEHVLRSPKKPGVKERNKAKTQQKALVQDKKK